MAGGRPGDRCQYRDPYTSKRCLRVAQEGGRCDLEAHQPTPGGRFEFIQRFVSLRAEGRDELLAISADPDLLDPRRPVALLEHSLSKVNLAPEDATLDELLRSKYRKSLALSGLSPTDIEPLVTAYTPTQAERDALRLDQADKAMVLIERYGKRQIEAQRMIEFGALMREMVIPVLLDLSTAMGRLIQKYVSKERQAEFYREMKEEFRATAGRLANVREQAVQEIVASAKKQKR